MRTQDEIVGRIEEKKSLPLQFQTDVLVGFLDFEHAKAYLKEGVDEKEWAEVASAQTREKVIEEMRDYWDFALDKVMDHRGISANRNVDKYQAWTWLLGEDSEIDWEEYANYGAPVLKAIGERYGFDIPEDEGFQRMARGERCSDDCMDGCGMGWG